MSSVTKIATNMHVDRGAGVGAEEPVQPTCEGLVNECGISRICAPIEQLKSYTPFSRYADLQLSFMPVHDALEVFQKVFSKYSPFVAQIKHIIGSYIPAEAGQLISASKPYRDFFISPFAVDVDFSRSDVLKNYLGKHYQSDRHVAIAASISTSIYEVAPRNVSETYGLSFCMYPEVLAYAMRLLEKDKEKEKTIAVEIGAASGEHSALLAFTDVDQVYMNEINQEEIEKFEKLKHTLPKDINKKLQIFEGSCLDLLDRKPHLVNKVDLVLCRNVIHFFNSEEQSQLFHVLKQVLKPGGRAIFTANSTTTLKVRNVKKHPEATCFTFTKCEINDFLRFRSVSVFHRIALCPKSLYSNESQELLLYERDSAQSSKWQVNNENFNKISSEKLKTKIQKTIQKKMDYMKTIRRGSVVVTKRTIQGFNKESLSRLFKMAGFEIETTFFVEPSGHLLPEDDVFNVKQHVGVVFRKPLESETNFSSMFKNSSK